MRLMAKLFLAFYLNYLHFIAHPQKSFYLSQRIYNYRYCKQNIRKCKLYIVKVRTFNFANNVPYIIYAQNWFQGYRENKADYSAIGAEH